MDDQFCVVDIIKKFIDYISKNWFIQQKFIGNIVYVKCFWIYQLIWFQVNMKIVVGQMMVYYFNCIDFNNFVIFIVCVYLVYIGGFGIEDNLLCNCSVYIGYLCQICVLLLILIIGSLLEMFKQVEIFIDGFCLGNSGSGGYGVILCYCGYEKMFSEGYMLIINNCMELMVVIVVFEVLKEYCEVILSIDS